MLRSTSITRQTARQLARIRGKYGEGITDRDYEDAIEEGITDAIYEAACRRQSAGAAVNVLRRWEDSRNL